MTWLWAKTLVPSEPQNSWDLLDVHLTKNVSIGIDPYPFGTSGKLHFLRCREALEHLGTRWLL